MTSDPCKGELTELTVGPTFTPLTYKSGIIAINRVSLGLGLWILCPPWVAGLVLVTLALVRGAYETGAEIKAAKEAKNGAEP
jgi:hypothetical protein